jgi:Cu(I)/Ag(I) efflux system protein CusF
MRKFVLIIASLMAFAVAPLSHATADDMVSGEVKKIDESAGKITLKHGPIKSLGMDIGMTMVFAVQDPSAIKDLKVGDKVMFQADRVNGQITVTKIEKAK